MDGSSSDAGRRATGTVTALQPPHAQLPKANLELQNSDEIFLNGSCDTLGTQNGLPPFAEQRPDLPKALD